MRFSVFTHSFGYLTQAAGVTLALSLAGIALGFVIGILVCVARLSGKPWLERAGAAYVSVFRGVPLLVLLLFIYYFLATVGLDVPALVPILPPELLFELFPPKIFENSPPRLCASSANMPSGLFCAYCCWAF